MEIVSKNSSIEHVFPKSFGCPDRWILNCVCKKCNSRLGGTVDRWLASDSVEAVRRLQVFGSRSGKRVRFRRLVLQMPDEKKYKYFQGAKLWLDFSRRDNIIFPSQVGLLNKKGEREFFTPEDINCPKILKKIRTLSTKDMRILGPSQEAHDQMVNLLKDKKIIKKYNIKTEGGLPNGAVDAENRVFVEAKSTIDRDIQRAIAKIAFNYLTKIKGCNFALKSCFDEAREFINGNVKKPIVTPSDEPILFDETKRLRHFDGHIFSFNRDRARLTSRVALFNGLSYTVVLAENMGPIWYLLKSGHAFNIHTRKIIPMFSAPKKFS